MTWHLPVLEISDLYDRLGSYYHGSPVFDEGRSNEFLSSTLLSSCYLTDMGKRKIALVDLTGCTGCEVHLISLGDQLLDIFQEFEVSNWRMVQDAEESSFDIAFVEGFVCNQEQVETLRQVRATCDVLVAMGACAISGNIFSQLTSENYDRCMQRVYGPRYRAITQFVKSVADFVSVDHIAPGCPVKLDGI